MAFFLESFRNSSMPKRLLRYALSRFDLLDADALNLDNLDLAWGRNTVLEFRDVGLKLNKLQHLLQLPPTFHIRRAKVALLRVTLPVDIYSSPIQIHVTGVDVRLQVLNNEAADDAGPGRRKRDRTGANSPGDATAAAAADDEAVPSAVDLAQSFLEHVPSGEAKALEEALAAEEEEKGDSDSYNDDDDLDDDDDDGSDDASQTLGTGEALSLPGFLAGFLQGIVDRTQVQIEGVTFELDVAVPVDATRGGMAAPAAAAASASETAARPESVTFQLALTRIHVEGVTSTSAVPATNPAAQEQHATTSNEASEASETGETGETDDDNDTTGSPPIVPKAGKRHISLENVRAFLISEANVFSTLARSPSLPSSLASRSPTLPARGTTSRPSTAAAASVRAFDGTYDGDDNQTAHVHDRAASDPASSPASSAVSSAMLQSQYALQDSEDAFNIPYELDDNDVVPEQPNARDEADEADEADDGAAASPLSTPRASVYGDSTGPVLASSSPLPSPPQPPLTPPLVPPLARRPAQQSAIVGHRNEDDLQWSEWGPEAQSEPAPRRFGGFPRPQNSRSNSNSSGSSSGSDGGGGVGLGLMPVDLRGGASSFHSRAGGDGSVGSAGSVGSVGSRGNPEELVQSHVFSHEEAESMYMSAFSQTESVRLRQAVPGGWDIDDAVQDGQPSSDVESPSTSAVFGVHHFGYGGDSVSRSAAYSQYQSTQLPQLPVRSSPELAEELAFTPTADALASSHPPAADTAADATANELAASVATVAPPLPTPADASANAPEGDSEEDEARSQPDEAATPRGPTRLVKEILALQYISIYVPSNHKPIDIAQPTTHPHHHSQHNHHDHQHKPRRRHQEHLAKSVLPHVPGAFSVYSSVGASSTLGDASSIQGDHLDESSQLPSPPLSTHQQQTPHEQQTADDKSVEVTLAPLEVRFDASIGILLAMVVSELLQSVKVGFQQLQQQKQQKRQRQQGKGLAAPATSAAATSSPAAAAATAATTTSAIPDIKVHAQKISLLFLDKLAAVTDTVGRLFEPPKTPSTWHQNDDVLLRTVLEDLVVAVSTPPTGPTRTSTSTPAPAPAPTLTPTTNASITLKRFRFGYADADIVSFDRRLQMRASGRDVFPDAGDDIAVTLTQAAGVTKCSVHTLPLRVAIDCQRLDETFSWFGGFSSFLSMGSSSISSVASQHAGTGVGKWGALPSSSATTTTAAATRLPNPPQALATASHKPRGVRFDAPISPDDASAAAENKVDVRVGGVHLDVIGKDCHVSLDTSAVKLVSREEGIGVGVSRIRLTGPYLRTARGGGSSGSSGGSGGEPPVTVELANTRLEYMNTPKDKDLERLLELITPSRVQFDEREDVIMVDTLLRQRRHGPLLRLHVDDLQAHVHNLPQLACLPTLGDEVARLATVAKYLPEDDRPGLLTLGLVRRLDLSADLGGRYGLVQGALTDVETAHITIPSLVSAAVGSLAVHRNHTEELIGFSPTRGATSSSAAAATAATGASPKTAMPSAFSGPSPALLLRIIGDDIEPVIKIKMWGLNFEYRVPTVMDLLGLADDATPQDFEATLAASVANLGEQAHTAIVSGLTGTHGLAAVAGSGGSGGSAGKGKGKAKASPTTPRTGGHPEHTAKPTTVDLAFRDCVVGLNPLGLPSKLNIVLVDARLEVVLPQRGEDIDAVAHLNKMALLLVDDVATLAPAKSAATPSAGAVAFVVPGGHRSSSGPSAAAAAGKDAMVQRLCARGFVDVCQISAAKVSAHIAPAEDGATVVDLEVRDDLLVLETCADSTQTLIHLANALTPPTPPSKEVKFKTEVMPVQDLLASISIDAFGRAEGNYNFDEDFVLEDDGEYYEEDDLYGVGVVDGGSGSGSGSNALASSMKADRRRAPAAVEQSVSSLPSLTADDDDLLLHYDDDDDGGADDDNVNVAVAGNDGMSGTVAEKLFSASSMFSDQTETPSAQDDRRIEGARHAGDGGPSNPNATLQSSTDDLGIEENFFGTASDTAAEESSHAHRWISAQNGYDKKRGRGARSRAAGAAGAVAGGGIGAAAAASHSQQPPLRVRVRDVHVIWNLFDGYDWAHTRDVIAKSVEEVEAKAYERRTRHRRRSGSHHDPYSPYADEDEEEATVIGDFLFNSIYIGIPAATHDPRELTQAINRDLDGGGENTATETESVAATSVMAGSSAYPASSHPRTAGMMSAATRGSGGGGGGHGGRSPKTRKLKLHRSRHHKITFELGGVSADFVVYPPGSGETQSSVDVRVRDLDIFDHVPTSTWKKFATYDRDAGERPIDGDMVHLTLMVVRPVPALAATEFVLTARVLPLRLHVDQDALDFITRFFAFQDEDAAAAAIAGKKGGGGGSSRKGHPAHASASDVPFIQRAEIHDIPVQLDFKPKRVDYAGLRSGHTTEFMNFLILDGAHMVLRHAIVYGITGFDRLGQTLNDIWMPDIKRHQLPGVLAGLAPVRSLVTVGSGVRSLIEIPLQEYRHNGRVVRSLSRGALAFARSTGTELVKLGAKVATGTQYVLQGAEGLLGPDGGREVGAGGGGGGGTSGGGGAHGDSAGGHGDDDDDDDSDAATRKQISLYADPPTDVVQGVRHAYRSLVRDLHVARDAIIAVPAEVRESTSATGAAQAVLRHAPTIVFRPAIGATKAIGQTLMGATNSLDPQNLRRVEDKYKSGPGRM
ncbi:Autophagy-related protein [Niveomyces insectorum RCEF 264]|uniref:Autophagy-related protein 2 n=1 Tax=Niveomyces insectorum RCEF 264 TaxID=1081102 RepID=A0A167S0Y8_9HYPO|nr:Autophagy-related protein [Niveomyces insectorum RCEF 264]